MLDSEIKDLVKRAKNYACKRGWQQYADDFAQEVYLRCADGIKTSFKNLFTDFLRKEFGDTRFPCGSARSRARLSQRSFDGHSTGDSSKCLSYADTLADPRGLSEFEHATWGRYLCFDASRWNSLKKTSLYEEVFQMLFIEEMPEEEIAQYIGVSASRVSQLKGEIKKCITKAMCLDDIWDEYHYDEKSSLLFVDWIAV